LKSAGALDGLFVKIIQPGSVACPRDYFSGHYQAMGINVQAMCDSKSRFIYVAIGGPGMLYQRIFHHHSFKLLANSLLANFSLVTGCTSDLRAYQHITAPTLVENLLLGLFILVADAAYMVSEQLLGPYHGEQRDNDANSYVSGSRWWRSAFSRQNGLFFAGLFQSMS
jgi:hypothetical protein